MKKLLLLLFIAPLFLNAQTVTELANFTSAAGKDIVIAGQANQLAASQNILLATQGTGALDITSIGNVPFKSVKITINVAAGTVTAGAITFEQSDDATFTTGVFALNLFDAVSLTSLPVSTYNIVASTSRVFAGNPVMNYIRARISTAITGTTTGVQAITRYFTAPYVHPVMMVGQPTAANLQTTATISGTPSVNATPVTYATNGTTTSTLNSAATTNATSLKASAGILYAVTAMNTSAAIKYVRIYNKASTPTVGTDIPIIVVAVPAGLSKEIWFPVGVKFATGIAYSITNAASATDATAVAAGDVQLLINWQ